MEQIQHFNTSELGSSSRFCAAVLALLLSGGEKTIPLAKSSSSSTSTVIRSMTENMWDDILRIRKNMVSNAEIGSRTSLCGICAALVWDVYQLTWFEPPLLSNNSGSWPIDFPSRRSCWLLCLLCTRARSISNHWSVLRSFLNQTLHVVFCKLKFVSLS